MTEILGIVNVTPDSFSDGGAYADVDSALAQARLLRSQGATIIDVGGESTRPGATPVDRETELARTIPVVRALSAEGIAVSIDTLHAETAAAAVAAGARYLNDVSGGLADPEMLGVAAEAARTHGATLILGHWRGIPDPDHERSEYRDVVHDVRLALAERAAAAERAGVPRDRIVIDPGLGFDKTGEQCWELLGRLDELRSLGYPVLVGASRKRMLADALAGVPGGGDGPLDRDLATSVVTALSARAGAWGVRVHDAGGSAQALAVANAWGASGAAAARGAAPDAAPVASALPAGPADRIVLTGLEVFAHHGVFAFERERGQRFVIDIAVELDLSAAASGDDLAHTVHYGELAEAIVLAVERDPVDLIETVAERVASVALGFPAAQTAEVTVHKPDAPIEATFSDVAVCVTRSRSTR